MISAGGVTAGKQGARIFGLFKRGSMTKMIGSNQHRKRRIAPLNRVR
jgi:hypothetical protein